MDDIIKEKWVKARRRQLEYLRTKTKDNPAKITKLIVSFAKSLGRKQRKGGKENNYESELISNSRAVGIPKNIKSRYTADFILDQLEGDIVVFEGIIEARGGQHGDR